MLTEKQGERLVGYAREVLEKYVRGGEVPDPPEEDFLQEKKGVFVTLKKNGELRGCIGLPRPEFPLGEATERAAKSATQDRRFPPVTEEELEEIDIEITVLTKPKKVEVDKPEEYLEEVEVGKHGLIIEKDGRNGLLLPQVPEEQGWNCREYLEGLCRKAMLPSEAWRDDSTEIKRFEGKILGEKDLK